MCSIIAGFDGNIVRELVELNQFRGNFSYSYTELEKTGAVKHQIKNFGVFEYANIDYQDDSKYKVCHVQAPTGGMIEDYDRIHPVSDKNNNMLWHNGIIVNRGIEFLQKKLLTNETFDTKLLFDAIQQFGFDILNDIEGLFSCMLLRNNELFIFRTKHGKLFVDADMNISSERFEGSKCINADCVYNIDLEYKKLLEVHKFKTKRFNVHIPGEL